MGFAKYDGSVDKLPYVHSISLHLKACVYLDTIRPNSYGDSAPTDPFPSIPRFDLDPSLLSRLWKTGFRIYCASHLGSLRHSELFTEVRRFCFWFSGTLRIPLDDSCPFKSYPTYFVISKQIHVKLENITYVTIKEFLFSVVHCLLHFHSFRHNAQG